MSASHFVYESWPDVSGHLTPDFTSDISYSKSRNKSRNSIVRKADKVCVYCNKFPTQSADHIIPRSRGGSDSWANLVGCCLSCNSAKDNLLPKEAGIILHLPLRFVCNRLARP